MQRPPPPPSVKPTCFSPAICSVSVPRRRSTASVCRCSCSWRTVNAAISCGRTGSKSGGAGVAFVTRQRNLRLLPHPADIPVCCDAPTHPPTPTGLRSTCYGSQTSLPGPTSTHLVQCLALALLPRLPLWVEFLQLPEGRRGRLGVSAGEGKGRKAESPFRLAPTQGRTSG